MAIKIQLVPSIPSDLTFRRESPGSAFQPVSSIKEVALPAEWYPQSGIQLTWPHRHTDWAAMLEDVTATYLHMALEIALRERLLIVTPEPQEVEALLKEQLPKKALENISLHQIETDDTWARDHGFLTVLTPNGPLLLDFCFNGWGKKFPATKDNQINHSLLESGALKGSYQDHLDFVLEGGSIESDGEGTLMTTSSCLLAPSRNEPQSREEISEKLMEWFHAHRILWLNHGYLAGDDTDGHVDTLARFCPAQTIAYVKCSDPKDEHYEELNLMEEELKAFRTMTDEPYRLLPLPMAKATYDEDGQRLPATYANFLIVNGAVLMPTYSDPFTDETARAQLQKAFPRHEVIGIDCLSIIQQHGSLHCSAMQFPLGVVKQKK